MDINVKIKLIILCDMITCHDLQIIHQIPWFQIYTVFSGNVILFAATNVSWFHQIDWCTIAHTIYLYSDVIMAAMASQITRLTVVYSTVYSGADQRNHQSSATLAFVRIIHRWPVNSPHKWPVTRIFFHLMTSSCTMFDVLWFMLWYISNLYILSLLTAINKNTYVI